jgi:hypothetical protein
MPPSPSLFRYGIKSVPTIVVLRPRLVEREGKEHLTNADRPLHAFEGAGPSTLVALTAAIVQNSTEAERAVMSQTLDVTLFDDDRYKADANSNSAGSSKSNKAAQKAADRAARNRAGGRNADGSWGAVDADSDEEDVDSEDAAAEAAAAAKSAAEEEGADDGSGSGGGDARGIITLAQLESNMENITVSEEECESYSTPMATVRALAGHALSGHAEIMSVLTHEPLAAPASGNEPFSALPFDVSQHPDAKSGVAIQMIARMEKDVAFVAENRKRGRQAVVADLNTALFDSFFGGDDAAHRDAQKAMRRARGRIAKLIRSLHELKAEDSRIVEATPPLLEAAANNVSLFAAQSQSPAGGWGTPAQAAAAATAAATDEQDGLVRRLKFKLNRIAGQESRIKMNLLCVCARVRGSERDRNGEVGLLLSLGLLLSSGKEDGVTRLDLRIACPTTHPPTRTHTHEPRT